MWNVVSEMVSYLNPVPSLAKYSCVAANAYEIVSGYMSPQDETDTGTRSPGSNRKQVGILYADIAGSAQTDRQFENEFQRQLEEAVNMLMINIADNDGRLVNMDGHAILAEFKDTDHALHCAINVQLAARQWNANLPSERQLLFRIGITYGDVNIDQEEPGSRSRCLAAYLEKLASVGGICISESVRAQLDDHPSLKLVEGGKQYVKNLCVPVETFWIEIDTEHFVTQDLSGAVKITATVS